MRAYFRHFIALGFLLLLTSCSSPSIPSPSSSATISAGSPFSVITIPTDTTVPVSILNGKTGKVDATIAYPSQSQCMGAALYLGGDRLAAFTLAGKRLWESSIIHAQTLTCLNHLIFAQTEDQQLLAFDEQGSLRWTLSLPTLAATPRSISSITFLSDPLPNLTHLLINPDPTSPALFRPLFVAIQSQSGAIQFRVPVPTTQNGFVVDNSISRYQNQGIIQSGSLLSSLDLATGATKWTTTIDSVRSALFCPNLFSSALIAPVNGKLSALSYQDGSLLWSYTSVGSGFACGAITHTSYVGFGYKDSGNGELFALNPQTGQELWHTALPDTYSQQSLSIELDPTTQTVVIDNSRGTATSGYTLSSGSLLWKRDPLSNDPKTGTGNVIGLHDDLALLKQTTRDAEEYTTKIDLIHVATGSLVWTYSFQSNVLNTLNAVHLLLVQDAAK